MKYVKILGLLAVAATAMMAFAASASATTLTAPQGTDYTGEIHATNEGTLTLDGVADIECDTSTVVGTVKSHGSSVTASGEIKELTFEDCEPHHVTVISGGTLEVHTDTPNVVDGNGILTSDGAEVTIEVASIFGTVHCTFVTNNTEIGTVTGAPSATTHATLDIESADIPVDPDTSSFLCGSTAEWTGKYTVDTPTGLYID